MLRCCVAAVCSLLLCTGTLFADVFEKVKVKMVDPAKSVLTVTIETKDHEYRVAPDAKIFETVGTGKRAKVQDLADGLKGLKAGDTVSIFTETKKDGKEVITQIKLESGKKK
jgi:Cu/Ag efflux protein CusF